MKVRPGTCVRAIGVALGCLEESPSRRSRVVVAGFACGWFLNRPGLQVATVVPDTEEPWKRTTVPFVTSVSAWSGAVLALISALRRTPVPPLALSVALSGAFVVLDSLLSDLGESRDASHERAEDRAEARIRPPSPQGR